MTPCTLKLSIPVSDSDLRENLRGGRVDVPNNLVRNRTHLIREAVFVASVFDCCDRLLSCRLLDILDHRMSVRIRDLVYVKRSEKANLAWRAAFEDATHPEVNVKVPSSTDLVRDGHLNRRHAQCNSCIQGPIRTLSFRCRSSKKHSFVEADTSIK